MRHLDDFVPADHPLRVIRVMVPDGHPNYTAYGHLKLPHLN